MICPLCLLHNPSVSREAKYQRGEQLLCLMHAKEYDSYVQVTGRIR